MSEEASGLGKIKEARNSAADDNGPRSSWGGGVVEGHCSKQGRGILNRNRGEDTKEVHSSPSFGFAILYTFEAFQLTLVLI